MANPICKQCRVETVEISDQTLEEIRSTIKPNFKTLAAKPVDGWWSICPACDSYALGLEMERGYPVRDGSGQLTEIHELLDSRGLPGF